MRRAGLLLLFLCASGIAGCADNPSDRGPWHEWLHTHGME
jgi:hypothetical protein